MDATFLVSFMLLLAGASSQVNYNSSYSQSVGTCSSTGASGRTYKKALLDNLLVVMTQYFSENSIDSSGVSTIDADLSYSLPELFAIRYGADASAASFLAGFLDILYADYSATTSSSDHLAKAIGLVRAGEFDAARFEASLLIISSLPSDFFPFDALDLTQEQYDILSRVIQAAFNSIRQKITSNQFEVYLNLKVGSTLSFAMDTTGSMAGEIEAAKQRTISIIESTRGTLQQPLLYVLSPFNDPATGPVTVTSDPSEMIQALNLLTASGGGDEPELALTGIQDAILASTRRSVVFMITDATAQDDELENRVIALAIIRKIRVITLLTRDLPSPAGFPLYTRISRASGGLVTVTDKDSIGSITTLFTTLTQQGQVKVLILPTSDLGEVTFNVDSALTHVTILLSAEDGLVNFDRIEHATEGLISVTTEVDAVGLIILSFIPRMRGTYTLYLTGTLRYSLEISGLSTFGTIPTIFESVDGNYYHRLQPRADTSAHIAASLFGNNATEEQILASIPTQSAVVERIILSSEDGNIIENIIMEQCGDENEYRTASQFQIPARRFFITLVGTDRLGLPFTRVDPCAVTPLVSDINLDSIEDQIVSVGNTVTVSTTLTNNEASAVFDVDVSDPRRFVTFPGVEYTLTKGASQLITFTITVPLSTNNEALSVVTITATPRGSSEFVFTTFSVIAQDMTILTCPASLSPLGSSITCTDLNNIGSTCTLTCEPEYAPVGAIELTCLSNQTWDGPELACTFVGSKECRITGDPHYLTFDGRAFDFQGTCIYTSVKTLFDEPQNGLEPFSVQTENQHLGGNTRVSWFRRAYVSVFNETFVFYQNYRVTVNGVEVTVPFNRAERGLRIALSGGNIELTTRFGLKIIYNGNYNFFIHLSASYRNLVEGLCGDFNEDSTNDLSLASDKTILVDGNDFGNSYKSGGLSEGCQDGSLSDGEGECLDREEYSSLCEIVNSDCFSECSAAQATPRILRNCVFDLCVTNGDKLAFIQSISEYAESCQAQGFAICDWRQMTGNPVTCRLNAHYEHEGTSCPNTCQFPTQATRCGRPVKSGCVCDDGFVLSGLECVSRTECGCTVDGRYYKHGEEAFNCTSRCTCDRGTYDCVSASCKEFEFCGVSPVTRQMACLPLSTSQFIATGDPHYTTLDGLNYDFQGACSYVVAMLDDPTDWFTIVSENENRGGNELVSYVKTATVYFQNEGRNVSVKLGSLLENKPYAEIEGVFPETRLTDLYQSSIFEIYRSGEGIVMEFRNIKIIYVASQIRITLPAAYSGRVKGLGGNFNGNPDDDLVTRYGTTTTDVNQFATSYQYGDCETPEPPLPFVCSPEDTAMYGGVTFCGLIKNGSFAACAAASVDIEALFNNCVYDVCANDGSLSILYQSLETAVQECNLRGSTGGTLCNWREELGVPGLACSENSHYEGCASSCPNTCLKPDAEESCPSPSVEGCVCNFGYILSEGGNCIRIEDCGCFTKAGYLQQGYTKTDSNCTQKCTCRGPNAYECRPITCMEEEICSFTGSIYECVPPTKTCALLGASYVSTFDKRQFNFNGTCTYMIAGSNRTGSIPQFRVLANKATSRGNGQQGYGLHVWVDATENDYGFRNSFNMRISTNAVNIYVDDFKVLPGTSTPDYTILQQSMFTVIQFSFGLTIRTGQHLGSVIITIPGTLQGKMFGLCGGADGNPVNEFLFYVNETAMYKSPAEFGNFWKRSVANDDRCVDGKDDVSSLPSTCQNRRFYQLFNSSNFCGSLIHSLSPLATCHDTVTPDIFFNMCINSACQNPNLLNILEESVLGYGIICSIREDPILFITEILGAGFECPAKSNFRSSLTGCVPTCSDPDGSCAGNAVLASFAGFAGCECDEGYIWNVDKCILRENCGCLAIEHGFYFEHTQCVWNETCSEKCQCLNGVWNCEPQSCYSNQYCGIKNGTYGCHYIDECRYNNGGCSHSCKSVNGTATCLCPNGMALVEGDDRNCKQITGQEPIDCGSDNYLEQWKDDYRAWRQYYEEYIKVFEAYKNGDYCTRNTVTSSTECDVYWTRWFDSDNSTGCGDDETLERLNNLFPGEVCASPLTIQTKLAEGMTCSGSEPVIRNSDVITGFLCENSDQPIGVECPDYAVRFLCLKT